MKNGGLQTGNMYNVYLSLDMPYIQYSCAIPTAIPMFSRSINPNMGVAVEIFFLRKYQKILDTLVILPHPRTDHSNVA